MESTNLLSKHCQTKEECRVLERYIRAAAHPSRWIISLVCGLLIAIGTVPQVLHQGMVDSSVIAGILSSTILLLNAHAMWQEKTIGTVLKRLSGSK